MRVIGLDAHRGFAVVAFLENGAIRSGARIHLARDAVIAFGRQLRADDEVVLEATGQPAVVARPNSGGLLPTNGNERAVQTANSAPRGFADARPMHRTLGSPARTAQFR
jgi:hypothetical protein